MYFQWFQIRIMIKDLSYIVLCYIWYVVKVI